ncbi:uncharacterized protein LOC120174353 [Hibiscus syriacus]|uniref:uncharacterized protein LOC120174353 n=1 Tax=Hibiscus syriacus TaxID=106335 RepID=UPI001920664D|nr:uncharacterized protein LOC120174353 [Hibiscus syriacus]
MVVVWFVVASCQIWVRRRNVVSSLQNLASCIPFVSGTAKKPAAVLPRHSESEDHQAQVLVPSIDPSLGLPVNTTSALQMPSPLATLMPVSNCPNIFTSQPPLVLLLEWDKFELCIEGNPSSINGDKVKVFVGANCLALMAWVFM